MSSPFTCFEVSWEVCNKVGGIYTVISTKARTAVERFGDDYVAVGPWLLAEEERQRVFEEEPGFERFAEGCRELGIPVRVGRWRVPGSPRTVLVEFSGLYDRKDDLLAELWERYGVDSISGGWDYTEPVVFGLAAGLVIERWNEEFLLPEHRRGVVHVHEWMAGAALLYLAGRAPSLGAVFTTHATALGRALSTAGNSPEDGLGDDTPEDLAEKYDVVAKHSLEGATLRAADVFTTLSDVTADEAELLHGRRPAPLLPNGIDLEVMDAAVGTRPTPELRGVLVDLASKFFGEDVSEAAFVAVSGRYEFHNKGMDVVLDALARMSARKGRRVVCVMMVPAGHSGLRSEVRERLERPLRAGEGPLGISTHNLFDEERDPIHRHCARLGLDNAPGSRIKVLQLPIYLHPGDGFLNLSYEALLSAMDLSCFPSYYEPWGYTPQESLAVGVPTITSDYAGFGRWALDNGLGPEDGITVVPRMHVEYGPVVEGLVEQLEQSVARGAPGAELARRARETAARSGWAGFFANYEAAWKEALGAVQKRLARGVPLAHRPRHRVAVQPAPEARAPRLTSFDVAATLPGELAGLERLARNVAWSWDPDAVELFAELSPRAWDASGHNPVTFLRRVYPEDLAARAADKGYLPRLERALARLAALERGAGTYELEGVSGRLSPDHPVAYFCAEFGLHESLRVYSGGLGILAGDHLKSASDLGVPLVAVGLFYRMGYLEQRVTVEGEQLAVDRENVPRDLPLEEVRTPEGAPLVVRLNLPGRDLDLRAWRVSVGRVPLYLLDADMAANRPEDREITRHLYGGDNETRLLQEIVLGRGGVRLLRELGIQPSVWHINEGHAAFLTLERVSRLVRDLGLSFEAARELVRATTLFTTHTPVPAGHDRFDEDMMRRYFSDAESWVGVPWERFLGLGQVEGEAGKFNMTYLALGFASVANGVSRLHGVASRALLKPFWPGLLEGEVPVESITNGVHLPTWTARDLASELGAVKRVVRGEDFELGSRKLSEGRLQAVRASARQRLLEGVRARLERTWVQRNDSPLLLTRVLDGLEEDALYVGFARRFAPYKRAPLLFSDRERLAALLSDPERPVRVIVAGKAHPADDRGRGLVREIAALARSKELCGKVFFLEDYDADLARTLVQGVDVWLNTPTRMQEASGTSGMKAAANGVLNLSIPDGWWPEAAEDGANGWVLGGPRTYPEQELQDQHDAAALYRLLEEEVVPLFFEGRERGLSPGWLERVRRTLQTIPPRFSSDRMVRDYARLAYLPLARSFDVLSADRLALVRERAAEKKRVRRGFAGVEIVRAEVADLSGLSVGDEVGVRMEVRLGELLPEDVVSELVVGHAVRSHPGELDQPTVVTLHPVGTHKGETAVFEGACRIERSGSYAYGLRVRAAAGDDPSDLLRDLVRWA